MDFKYYVEERMFYMYSSYNSPLLEGFGKKEQSEHVKMCKAGFLNYLEHKYDDKDIRYEIKSAETHAEREKIAKKYAADFEEWKKHAKKVDFSLVGMYVSSLLGFTTGAPTYFIVFFLFYGMLVKAGMDMNKKRDEIAIAKYKKNKK